MNRRSYCLAVGAAGFAGLSGCLGSVDGEIRPETEPDVIPSFVCDDDAFERLSEPSSWAYSEEYLHWGDTEDFSMRVNKLEFDYGETAEIELGSRGLLSEGRGTATRWFFEIYTEEGWRGVRGTTDEDDRMRISYDDVEESGDAEWTIELTEDGILDANRHGEHLEVCPDLVTARYRFVFWGLLENNAIAVAFDITV